MAGSIVGSQVEEPPLPGGRYPKEYVTACFSASGASVASVSYTFNSSFGAAPSVWGGAVNANQDTDIGQTFAASLNASSVTLVAHSADNTNSSFTAKTTFLFSE